jgi:hypothetical protein
VAHLFEREVQRKQPASTVSGEFSDHTLAAQLLDGRNEACERLLQGIE